MAEPELSLAEARRQVRRIVDQVEAVRWQLLGLMLSLPEPPAELFRLEEVGEELDALADLRTTLACILEDYIGPTHRDLRDLMPGSGGQEREV